MDTIQLKRIADAIEEILRLVKKIWNHEPRKRINVHLLEYLGRCNAVPAQLGPTENKIWGKAE